MSEEKEGKHGVQSLEIGMGILRAMVNGHRSMMLKDIAAAAGESWAYYIVGSVVEVLLLVAIFRIAWKWPSAPVRHDDANQQA